jgi:nucleotide-binding universal stress UspA family protein
MAVKRIIVPLDFSDLSPDLVEYATSLAKCFGAKLFLVHIVQLAQVAEMFGDIEGGIPALAEPEVMNQIKTSAQKQLDKLKKQVESKAVEVESAIITGVHFMEIAQFAEDKKADLIVIGSHGRSGWQRFVLGSVAEKVARHSQIPVLIFKPSPPHKHK